MKTARRSFNKTPYICKKSWSEDTFCQCGGDGVVFTEGSMEKTLTDPKESIDAIKTVLGEESTKKHYRTAFFEAFPNNPSCFIRGQGKTIEEAENQAWLKYEKILSCNNHDWDRKGRSDGYAYCIKCPLSGSFLEPLTKCMVCQIPTSEHTDKNENYFCLNHYYNLDVEQAVSDNEKVLGFSKEKLQFHFLEEKCLFKEISKLVEINPKLWKKIWNLFIQVRAQLEVDNNPFFSKPTKSDLEIHTEIVTNIETIGKEILKSLKVNY